MKIRNFAVAFAVGLCAHAAAAQSPATPPPETPAAPVAPPPTSTPAAPVARQAEGTLFKTQRSNSERGKFEWICTYRVAGQMRSVLLDESCPSTMVFELKR